MLAIEILSPDSVERDVVTKRREYAEAGLRHHWLVDLEIPAIVAYRGPSEYARARADEVFAVAEPFDVRLTPRALR